MRTLVGLAATDPRVVLLTGDLGYTVLEPFAQAFPDRFYNAGVAEQNMVGVATGLAESGFVPFVYSIATFATLRSYEFIRNGPIAHMLPVRIVGVGGGFDYGSAGFTHYSLEDLSVMRTQPGITVIAPADHEQTSAALAATWNLPGPIYFRIGKEELLTVPGLDGRFNLGLPETVRDGDQLVIVAIGSTATTAVAAAEQLAARGLNASVVVVSTLNPASSESLINVLSGFPIAISIEAHYINGGVGSLLAELIAENQLACRLVRCGVREMPHGRTGSSAFMDHLYGISKEALVDVALGQFVKVSSMRA